MSKEVIPWFIGPQILGVTFLLIGCIQKTWPPKKINGLYGYRSDTAKQSQAAWDEGNRYAAMYMIWAGVVCLIAGAITTVIIRIAPMPADVKFAINYLLILTATMGSVLSMMVKTESHLEKMFGPK